MKIRRKDMFEMELNSEEKILDKLKSSNRPKFICGTYASGREIYSVCRQEGIDIEGFTDSHIDGQVHYKERGKTIDGVKVYHTNQLRKKFKDADYIIAVGRIHEIINDLKKQGISRWYAGGLLLNGFDHRQVHQSTYQINEDKFLVENTKNLHNAFMQEDCQLIYNLDVMITERCSLKCKDCCNLMQYYEKPENLDTNQVIDDINELLKYVDFIGELRLIGGDAFMNKNWDEFVQYCLLNEQISKIVLYTNGVIIPKQKKLSVLSNERVLVRMTDYGKLSQNTKKITKLFDEFGVWYHVRSYDTWTDCASLKKYNRAEEQNDQIFEECCAKGLTTLSDSKIYRCPFAANASRLGAVQDNENDYVHLFEKGAESKLNNYLTSTKSMSICDYCDGKPFSGNTIPVAIQTKSPLKYEKYINKSN